jgi:flagellar basal body-associated protein FliL
MAEKAEKKPEAGGGHAPAGDHKEGEAKKGGGLLTKTPILLGVAMFLEAIVLFAGFKFLGGAPKPAAADVAETKEGAPKAPEKKKTVEVQVLDFRAPNKVSGRTLLFDVSISVIVKGDDEEKVKGKITDSSALIKDRVRTIIAQMDPEKLGGGSEPGLETLKRQVKYQLDEILGEGMIDEVLVGRCIPFRAEY